MSFATQIGAAIVAVVLVGPAVYAVIDRDPPIERVRNYAAPYEVVQGGTLNVHWDYWKTRTCQVAVDEEIVDSAGTRHHLGSFVTDGGLDLGHLMAVTHTVVPPDTEPGKAIYYRHFRYQCNPVQVGWPIRLGPPDIPPVVFEIIPN